MPPARSGRSSPSRPCSRASTASPGTSGCRCPTGRRSRSSRRATTTIPTRSPSSATPRRIFWPRPCAGCIPDVKVAIGPPIENGFYYDFEFPEPIREEDLAAIEAEILREIGEGRAWTREAIGRDAARARFEAEGEPYKVELVDTAEGDISLYTQGDFTDLCRGPHLQDSSPIKAVKLTGPRRRLLARRREEHAADPDLRHGVLHAGRPRRLSRAARAGAGERPPPARARSSTSSTSRTPRPARPSGTRRA